GGIRKGQRKPVLREQAFARTDPDAGIVGGSVAFGNGELELRRAGIGGGDDAVALEDFEDPGDVAGGRFVGGKRTMGADVAVPELVPVAGAGSRVVAVEHTARSEEHTSELQSRENLV